MAFNAGGRQSSFGRIPADSRIAGRPGTRRARILCYGDSNTAGFCSNGARFEPYAHSLSKELGKQGCAVDIVLNGCNGLTTQEMLQNLGNPMLKDVVAYGRGLEHIFSTEGQQDLAIIMTGTNDLGKGTPAEGIMQLIDQMHQVCHKRGVPTIALAPPTIMDQGPYRHQRNRLAQILSSWASQNPLVLDCLDCEMLVPRAAFGGLWEHDQLHMSPSGSKELGRRLVQPVLAALMGPQRPSGGPQARSQSAHPRLDPRSPSGSPNQLQSSTTMRAKPATPVQVPPRLTAGQAMEYFSTTVGGWIPCVITEVLGNGKVYLDVKPGHPIEASKLRPPQGASIPPPSPGLPQAQSPGGLPPKGVTKDFGNIVQAAPSQYRQGQEVEYHSQSNGGWILATVKASKPNGDVELDVKPGHWVTPAEQAHKIRPRRELDRDIQLEEPMRRKASFP
mmetsp:Transcript_6925/g.12284  ORF Transcript_6925/g.12284 Transcript_6925/m.12284 type:complete len:447 (+) Transcript_6925:184-1524(+)